VRNYHERDAPHCPELGPITERALTAVLDGQQRLTALNIGLRGSLSIRRKYGWRTNPNAFPRWELYLNLLSEPVADDDSDDSGNLTKGSYQFRLLEGPRPYEQNKELWFRCGEILTMPTGPDMLNWLMQKSLERDDLKLAYKTLDRLYQVVHKEQDLQLLDGAENNEKRHKLPAEWMDQRYNNAAERRHHLELYDMGSELPIGINGFPEFYEARRSRLRSRVLSILNG